MFGVTIGVLVCYCEVTPNLLFPELHMTYVLRQLCLLATLVALGTTTASSAGTPSARLDGFIANVGQWPVEVLFCARQNGADVWITRTGVVVDAYQIDKANALRIGDIERQVVVGQTTPARVSTGIPVSHVSFFRGNSAAFVAPVYSSVLLGDVMPGVHFAFSLAADGRVVRTLVAARGADLSQFSLERIGTRNELMDVSVLTSTVFGTYLGGPQKDEIVSVARLSNSDVIVAGNTQQLEFPQGTTGGYSTTLSGTSDGFVVRYDWKLQKVLSYTFVGGSSDDRIHDVAIDKQNNIYVSGETNSQDLPTTTGVSGKIYKAGQDAFVAKFDSTLSKLGVCFYHGGNKDDAGYAVAIDGNGLIYLAGGTNSTTNFPVTFPVTIRINIPGGWGRPPSSRDEPGGGANMGQIDGFIASFSANGSLQQSRFFGREGIEYFNDMAVDKSSSVYLTGVTTSANFETAPTSDRFSSGRVPYDRTFNGGNTDAFVVKLNNELALAKSDDGTYSTFFGGDGEDAGRGVFVDELGRATVVGVTTSKNLPTVGTLFTQRLGDQDIFMAVLSDDGRELNSATYYGGSAREEVMGATQYQGTGTAVIYGSTTSMDFPVTGDGSVSERGGGADGFMALINTSTNKFATLINGDGEDTVRSVAVDHVGDLYYAVATTSTSLRAHDSAAAQHSSGSDMYVAKHAFGVLELTSPAGGDTWCVGSNRTISWSTLGFADSTNYYVQIAPEGTESWTDLKQRVVGRNLQWKVTSMPTGRYVVRVCSYRGHVSKLLTPLTISNPPAVTKQPSNTSACVGQPATLTVEAAGALLKYQWRKGSVDITGATSATLTIPSVDQSTIGQYACTVSGACSPSVVTQPVTVSIGTATAITSQPAGLTVEESKSFTLRVVASGSGLSYQWKKDGSPIADATAAEYTIPGAALTDAGSYVCTITGGCGTVTSDPAVVVVTPSTSVTDDRTSDVAWLRLIGPVPAHDVVAVELVGGGEEYVVTVLDLQGRTLSTLTIGSVEDARRISIATDQLAKGTYIAQFRAGNRVGHVRFSVGK